MTIGNMPAIPGKAPDTNNFASPVCVCPKGGIPTPGISMGIWEPIAMIDIVKEPMCFANLGGMSLGAGISDVGTGTQYTPVQQIALKLQAALRLIVYFGVQVAMEECIRLQVEVFK